MSKTDYKKNSDYKSVVRIVYVICVFLVLYFILGIYQNGASGVTSTEDPRLMTYNELKDCEKNLQVPKEWKFLTNSNLEQRQKRTEFYQKFQEEMGKSALRNQQVTEGVATIAKNLREKNEAISHQPVSPLLKRSAMRKHPNQTYEPEDLETLSKLEEKPVLDSPQDLVKRQTLAKPTGMEPEILPEDAEVPTIDVVPQNPESKAGMLEDPVPGLAPESLDQTANSRNVSPFPEVSPQRSAIVNPRLQNKVRIKTGQDRAEDLLKYLDDVPEEGIEPEQEDVETLGGSQQQYNREEGMEILRKFNQIARDRLVSYSRDVRDYSLFLYKWDTTNTRSDGMDVMYVKLREEPYSIYSFTFFPKRTEGREMLYWDGHYDGRIVVNSGPKMWNRTLMFRPDSSAIRNHSTRSVLNLGFRKLLEELIDISSRAEVFDDAEIRYYDQAKVGERACYALEVTFPNKTPEQDFYQIRIFVDRELTLPIQIAIYDWPEKGKSPKLLESYTYVVQQMNVGFQDRDFCHLNPLYGFNSYIPDLSEREADFMKELIPPEERKEKKN